MEINSAAETIDKAPAKDETSKPKEGSPERQLVNGTPSIQTDAIIKPSFEEKKSPRLKPMQGVVPMDQPILGRKSGAQSP